MNSVCHYFIEYFCIKVHEEDWSVILFFVASLCGFCIRVNVASYKEFTSVPSLVIPGLIKGPYLTF